MESSTAQSSPTIRSHQLSSCPISDLELGEAFLRLAMDDNLPITRPLPQLEAESAEPGFFDLQVPTSKASDVKVEDVMKRLFSSEHLHFILGDHVLFYRFSSFLNRYKSHLVPTLVRYLEMRKTMKAVEYANAVARAIQWPSHTDYCKFSRVHAAATDVRFEDYAARELLLLCSEALPAFITHSLVELITDCVSKDVTGQAIPLMHDLVGNLAEVFCLTDPSVHDNPVIFASEEFHRTTQYGTSYAIDRNCRFLQGPATDKDCTLRIAKAVSLGQESNEMLLNYRRDGTPFVNLLMCAPLYDDKGVIRYFIGAQIDVTGLVVDGLGIESFRAMLQQDGTSRPGVKTEADQYRPSSKQHWHDEKVKEKHIRLRELSLMFGQDESEVVIRHMRGADETSDNESIRSSAPTNVGSRGQTKRVIGAMGDPLLGLSSISTHTHQINPGLPGVYRHYLLIRPYPSLQIIFVSPSLRLPGLLRTHLFSKIGGPAQTIAALESAFRDGASVTARVLWLPKNSQANDRGRPLPDPKARFMRCTPLLGSDDKVGVWMVILVPVEEPIGFMGYGRHEYEMSDEVVDGRRRLGTTSRAASRSASLRTTSSFDAGFDTDGDFQLKNNGLRKRWSATPMGVGRGDDERQLYADYLRSSVSTASTVEGIIRARGSDRERAESRPRIRNDSVVASMRERDGMEAIPHIGTMTYTKESTAVDAKFEVGRRRSGIVADGTAQVSQRRVA